MRMLSQCLGISKLHTEYRFALRLKIYGIRWHWTRLVRPSVDVASKIHHRNKCHIRQSYDTLTMNCSDDLFIQQAWVFARAPNMLVRRPYDLFFSQHTYTKES